MPSSTEESLSTSSRKIVVVSSIVFDDDLHVEAVFGEDAFLDAGIERSLWPGVGGHFAGADPVGGGRG